jgi:ABC-2 type transport system permease protein
VEAPVSLAPAERVPSGWRIISAKEFADHILSIRFLLLFLVLGLVGAGAVFTVAGSIRTAASQATGLSGVFLLLFTANPQTSFTSQLPPFVQLIGFLGPLLGITFGFDAISSERSEGTLPRLLSQPIHRDDVINGKFLAGLSVIAVILAAVTVLLTAVGLIRLGLVPSGDEIVRLIAWYVISIVYVGFWLALAMLFSVLFRRAATAALAVIAIWLVLTIFGSTIIDFFATLLAPLGSNPTFDARLDHAVWQQNLSRVTPNQLYSEAGQVLLNPRLRTVDIQGLLQVGSSVQAQVLPVGQSLLIVWPQIVGLLAMTVVCFGLAYVSFLRQEVRA